MHELVFLENNLSSTYIYRKIVCTNIEWNSIFIQIQTTILIIYILYVCFPYLSFTIQYNTIVHIVGMLYKMFVFDLIMSNSNYIYLKYNTIPFYVQTLS